MKLAQRKQTVTRFSYNTVPAVGQEVGSLIEYLEDGRVTTVGTIAEVKDYGWIEVKFDEEEGVTQTHRARDLVLIS